MLTHIVIFLLLLLAEVLYFRMADRCNIIDKPNERSSHSTIVLRGRLVMQTGDVSYLVFLMVYGVDGMLTIVHRILLHENLGEAHRKHAYQLMANELQIGHVKVSLFYMGLQLLVSLIFVCYIPNSPVAHWTYFGAVLVLLSLAYVAFMKKFYHLHEQYLASLKK